MIQEDMHEFWNSSLDKSLMFFRCWMFQVICVAMFFFPAHLRHDVCGYMIYGPTISNVRLVCFYRPGTGSAFRSRAAEPIRFTESDVGKMWQKPLDISLYYKHSLMYICTLWLFNIAMENGPFIDGLPGFTYWKWWLSMAMLNNQMV